MRRISIRKSVDQLRRKALDTHSDFNVRNGNQQQERNGHGKVAQGGVFQLGIDIGNEMIRPNWKAECCSKIDRKRNYLGIFECNIIGNSSVVLRSESNLKTGESGKKFVSDFRYLIK